MLEWTTFYRFRKAKNLSLYYAMKVNEKLTSVGCVVISKSEKKLKAVERYWCGIFDAIDAIEKIEKI